MYIWEAHLQRRKKGSKKRETSTASLLFFVAPVFIDLK